MVLRVRIWNAAYGFLCLSGLSYQIFLVTREYFKYGVSTSTTLTQSDVYTLPSLSTCLLFPEVFNYAEFNQKYNSNFVFNDTNAETTYESGIAIQKLVTLDDMHQFTPSVENLIDTCEIRNSSSLQYHYYESDMCHEKFRIEKFTISAFVCFKITLKEVDGFPNIYSRETSYFTPSDQGDLMFIYFNESHFGKFDIIVNVMHPTHSYPWYDFPLSQIRVRDYDAKSGKSTVKLFGSKSSSIVMNKLPPPYVTSCQDYADKHFRDSQHCLLKCIHDQTEGVFHKASLVNHYFKGKDLSLLSLNDFDQENFSSIYRSIFNECHQLCPSNDCTFMSTYTSTTGYDYTHSGIWIMLPDRPSFTINFREKVLFVDTVTFICSTLGIWFGFSFYAINPSKIFSKSTSCSSGRFRLFSAEGNRKLISALIATSESEKLRSELVAVNLLTRLRALESQRISHSCQCHSSLRKK